MITSPSDVLVTIGQTITMSCSAMLGTPVIINYRWTKDNDIVGTSDQRVTLTNGNLSIENFMETDRGKYECIAELSISGINSPPVLWSVGSGFYTEGKVVAQCVIWSYYYVIYIMYFEFESLFIFLICCFVFTLFEFSSFL